MNHGQPAEPIRYVDNGMLKETLRELGSLRESRKNGLLLRQRTKDYSSKHADFMREQEILRITRLEKKKKAQIQAHILKRQENHAAAFIQMHFQRHKTEEQLYEEAHSGLSRKDTRRLAAEELRRREAAKQIIQERYVRWVKSGRLAARRLQLARERSAVKLQSCARMRQARKEYLETIGMRAAMARLQDNAAFFEAMRQDVEAKAAAKVQALARGASSRRNCAYLRHWSRTFMLRVDTKVMWLAIRLQSLYRGRKARELAAARKAKKRQGRKPRKNSPSQLPSRRTGRNSRDSRESR